VRRKRGLETQGDVFERLLKIIEEEKKNLKLPLSSSLEVPPAVQQTEDVELEPGEGSKG